VNTNKDSIEIDASFVREAAERGIALGLFTASGGVEFSPEALTGMALSGAVVVRIVDIDVPQSYSSTIPADAAVFSASILVGGQEIHNFNGTITLMFAYALADGEDAGSLYVGYFASDGSIENMGGSYEDGYMVVDSTHCSDFAILHVSEEDNSTVAMILAAAIAVVVGTMVAASSATASSMRFKF